MRLIQGGCKVDRQSFEVHHAHATVISPDRSRTFGLVLLFRFVHERGPLKGQDFWATPGGEFEGDETFKEAALRELKEETGIEVSEPGLQIFQREFTLQLPDGERVAADERYFVIEASNVMVSRAGWTTLEQEVMKDFKWWSVAELEATNATVWPNDLAAMLRSLASEAGEIQPPR